jgi:hypothetical protein
MCATCKTEEASRGRFEIALTKRFSSVLMLKTGFLRPLLSGLDCSGVVGSLQQCRFGSVRQCHLLAALHVHGWAAKRAGHQQLLKGSELVLPPS